MRKSGRTPKLKNEGHNKSGNGSWHEMRQSFITITQHIPDKRFQMVRYYGWYSNKMRGQRRKREEEAQEEAARKSAATAEQGCGAGASAAIEIIEHRESKPRRIPSRPWRELIMHDHA